jgi:hypothetical protein
MSAALGAVLFIIGFELLLLTWAKGSEFGYLSMTKHLMVPYRGLCLAFIGLGILMIIWA